MTRYVLLLLLLSLSASLSAQKFLQLEKRGSLKTFRYYPGDEIAFELDEQWYQRYIQGLDVDQGLIYVEDGVVEVEKITHFKRLDAGQQAVTFSNMLWTFGAGWLLFSVVDGIAGNDFKTNAVTVPLGAGLAGGGIRLFGKARRHRIGEKWRLRMLDLTMPSPGN